ncbi:peptidoglycan-binding protein [Ornithinimicrobium faecis]|uniref:Peptidoglycan-binding protein n=1 Tax=Ornithinimicrobium faecis TaxID=2934158 RepID=A0ABY4YVE4_9MICO|nr:peptidoglycan-binding protein [Ornithinimicrobium sp. HY1793]USQ80225.1 peptidoglycan-binding protein [Ornithinimicrobium sp. HY1793]
MLGAALAISMTQLPVWADGEEGGGTAPVEQAAPVAPPTDGEAPPPADGEAPPADGTAPEEPPADDAPADPAPSDGGGYKYGGRATGPMPLETLPEDPNYPVPEPPAIGALPEGVELPEETDDPGVFQTNIICDPVTKPGVLAVANLLGDHYDRPGYTTSRSCIDQRSEHYDGRAVDWQLDAGDPQERRIGDAAVTWLTANDGEAARRLGIQSIIWNHRSWHSSGGVWQGYVGQSPHTDHVHISLNWDGANMRTSWWTGVAVTTESADQGPCSVIGGAYAALPQAARTQACAPGEFWPENTDFATVRPGGQGEGVALVQPLLEVEQTGVLDEATRRALIEWQGEKGVPQTGVMDQLTYAAALGQELPELPEGALAVERSEAEVTEFTPLKRTVLTEGAVGEDVKVLQDALGVDGDGVFGPLTAEALTEFATEQPLLRDDLTETDTLVWELLEREAYPHLQLRTVELAIEDQGYPVTVLQELLELEGDGIFGPLTQQAVLDAQAAAELEQTGIVDAATWQAIDEAATARAEAEKADAENADAEKAETEAAADEVEADAEAEADAEKTELEAEAPAATEPVHELSPAAVR